MNSKGFKINRESVDKLFPKHDIDSLGYESPIEVVIGQIRMEQENNIYKVIQDYGVSVDKDELIKALRYDRDQYAKGYINGYNAKSSDVAREIIEQVERMLTYFPLFGTIESYIVDVKSLAELKKKYTEGER